MTLFTTDYLEYYLTLLSWVIHSTNPGFSTHFLYQFEILPVKDHTASRSVIVSGNTT